MPAAIPFIVIMNASIKMGSDSVLFLNRAKTSACKTKTVITKK
jgi:hypothetical protein